MLPLSAFRRLTVLIFSLYTQHVSPTEASGVKREIEIEVPAAEVTRETESLIQKYQKTARLPGFRRGHVPASIIRQRFSEDLKSDVVEVLVPRYFRREADKLGLKPVSQPRVTDLHVHENEPLRFKASFEVMPDIKVEGYRELRAEKAEVAVTDEEIEQTLNGLREQHASYTTLDGRQLQDGDFAQAALDGHPKDGQGKPIHMDEVLVEIGGKNTMPEFTENLRGVSAGEERTFDVTYPEDSSDRRLAGKSFTYTVKVQSAKQKTLPELNDAFAKELGEFADLAEVRKRIREGMEAERKQLAEREAKEKLVEQLVKRNEFEVPDALVERQLDSRLDRGLRSLVAQGLRAEDLKKMDLKRLRSDQREQAMQDVKASLLLEKIAEEERIEVGEEEVNREIEALAAQSKQTPEAIRARLTEDGALDRIRARIRNDKALDLLYRQSA
ncbi:MAG TPA: trigger factor [Terriglobales bacterium]|nr:trigger factor [Terriglobales bacterium]